MTKENDSLTDRGDRIAKLLARAGVGSRRDIERMIEEGRISLNGAVLTTPATLLTSLEGVSVDGKPVAERAPTMLWRFHKPKGVITTHKDPQGRKTVFDLLPQDRGRLISIGRLDLNSEGLLLLTNDGELARYFEHPSTALMRRYKVRVHGDVNEAELEKLKDGITVEGVRYGAIDAVLERKQGSNAWLNVTLSEGKNREIRKVFSALNLPVNRLIRVAYGPFSLGTLKAGDMQLVPAKDWGKIARPVLERLTPDAPIAPKRKPKSWAKAKAKPARRPQRGKVIKPGRAP